MKKILLFLFSISLAINTSASHFSGGEIRYEFNGTNYDVYLSFYKLCEGGINLFNYANVYVSSASLQKGVNVNTTFLGFDTVDVNCPNALNRCYSLTGTLPGYIKATFKGTVTLPGKANDWLFSWTGSARIYSLENIVPADMYLYTWLDNTHSINSNAKMVDAPTYYVTTGDTTTIPLNTKDPEGDSIAYKFVQPRDDRLTSFCSYRTGYTLTAPFGANGYAALDATTHSLYVKPPIAGTFTIAFEVEEYRGGALVGRYVKDIVIVAMNTLNPLSFPLKDATNVPHVYTCPGKNNKVDLSYHDIVLTDSVYIDVDFPNFTGWNFSATTTNGLGAALTKLDWTTPANFDPATLPHFYINIKVRDNACPSSTVVYNLLVRTRQCSADTVWPGDANGDKTVNIYDPLYIAIANGKTGPSRMNQGINWAKKLAPDYNSLFFTNMVDMKHADCNGNGVINNQDLTAVNLNYGKSHPKGGRAKPTGSNDLYFDMTGIRLELGKTVSIPIKLGNVTQTINDVYGLGTRININGIQLDTPPTVTNTGSWIDNATTAMNFVQEISTSTIEWAHARIDQQNVSGNGTVGMLQFTVPNDPTKVGKQVTFSFEDPFFINNLGLQNDDINTVDGSEIVIFPSSIGTVENKVLSMAVIPNPSHSQAVLKLATTENTRITAHVVNVTGQTVWSNSYNIVTGNHQIELPSSELPSGMYTIRVESSNGERSVMKWIKQ